MYAPPSYGGFAPTNNSHPFNPNGGLQQPHNPHQQQQPQPQQQQQQQHQQHQQHQQQQHPGQQPQGMMFNPQAQAYAAAPHQSPYGTAGPGMGGNAGGMGMMQNSGLAHVPGGQMAQYQTPYTSSPYGTSIPTSSSSSLPQNFIPTTSTAPSFPMNTMNMNPQQNRMQPPPTLSTPTQRAPYGGIQQNTTPPSAGNTQSQFPTPQATNQNNIQTNVQAQGGSVGTPQTPNFPSGSQGAAGQALATPLSPGSESREKERVTVLLDINSELLMESLRLQNVQAAEKEKDAAGTNEATTDTEKVKQERADKAKVLQKEYIECMRRLQGNLAYLAAIADRSHKPSSQIPSHPQVISAPPLAPRTGSVTAINPKDPNSSLSSSSPPKSEDSKDLQKGSPSTGDTNDVNRPERLNELYKRLQALFPGVDPKKEQSLQQMNAAAMRARAQAQAQAQAQAHGQAYGQAQAPVQSQLQGQPQPQPQPQFQPQPHGQGQSQTQMVGGPAGAV